MKKVTVWYKETKGVYKHNHIEDGWNTLRAPQPKSLEQQVWLKQNWLKHSKHINDKQQIL